jgi:hypothetical protein
MFPKVLRMLTVLKMLKMLMFLKALKLLMGLKLLKVLIVFKVPCFEGAHGSKVIGCSLF